MTKTYYCKCGNTFKKSSSSAVTRYEKLDDKCKDCPYIEHSSSYRGGKETPITFCQAGSKKPLHKNDYSTTSETDSTTLSIISLDMNFLYTIYEYARSQPGISGSSKWPNVFHGLDKEDCRKSMPLYFENNKKGKAAKKSIIDKFFKELQQEKLDSCKKCFECTSYLKEGENLPYGKCTERRSIVTNQQMACDAFNPVNINIAEKPADEANKKTCADCIFCRRSEKAPDHGFIYKCFNANHRVGMDWYFGVNSDPCKSFKASKLTCSNCINQDCGEMYPEGCHNTEGIECKKHSDKSFEHKEDNTEKSCNPDWPEKNCIGGEMKVYYEGTACDNEDCKFRRDGKCSIETVSGSALKHFVMDSAAPCCEIMKTLKERFLKEERHCSHAHKGCNAVLQACSLNGVYCCYTCKNPCNSYCGYAQELVPLGLLRDEDKGNVQLTSTKPAYIYSMGIDTADEQAAALSSHLHYIRNKCKDIVGNYVEIGFTLINIKENKLYKARGYENLIECVEAELNMKKSTAYNLIKIAEKFGDTKTKRLKTEYSQFNYVQCLEMSTMTKEELSQANPDMSKRDMQELKKSNRLENSNSESKIVNQSGNGLVQLIEDAGNIVIDITEYKVVDNNKDSQEQPEYNCSVEGSAADDQGANLFSLHSNELSNNKDSVPNDDPVPANEDKQTTEAKEQPEVAAADNNDTLINKLLIENDEYKMQLEDLQKDKNTFRELVNQIDSNFDKLTKKQICNALWDFISTGMIIFEQE
jgi:Protein of unknown function (DUF3102).